MVALSEISNMFWGLTLDGGKRYTQTVHKGFHISMAALEMSQQHGSGDRYVAVMLQHEKTEFLLCTLEHGKLMQQTLDLNFNDGEEVTFFLNGKGVVHLTGYLMSEDSDDLEMPDSEDDSDEEVPQLKAIKRGNQFQDDDSDEDEDQTPGKRRKKQKLKELLKRARLEEDSDEESDDDYDSDLDDSYGSLGDFINDEAEEDSDEEDSDDDDFIDDDSDDSEMMEKLARMGGSLTATKQKTPKDKLQSKPEKNTPKGTPQQKLKTDGKTPKSAKKSQNNSPSQKSKDNKPKDTPGKKNKDGDAKKQPETPKQKGDGGQQDTPASKKKKKNKNKGDQGTPVKGQDAAHVDKVTPSTSCSQTSDEPKKKKKKKKKNKESLQQTDSTQDKSSPAPAKAAKRVLEGGILCEEKKGGHGPPAKPGKTVHVYYTGRLQNGKVFDSSTSGKPFKFKLGKNEVIRGWDLGLDGMKVGSKRKITIPPKMGYGAQRMGDIPANSTLVFDVEMKAVS